MTTDTGALRTFFGPPRTPGESTVGSVGSALVIALLVAYVWRAGGWHGWSVLQIVVLAAMIFDLIFGIFTISTPTAKRWYHRPGARRFRVTFVMAHVAIYLVPFAALFDTGWVWCAANAGLLVGFAIAIELAPWELKSAVALCLTLTVGLVNLIWLPLPATLAWFPVVLAVKVLLCFLVPETPRKVIEIDGSAQKFETTAR
ncbi:MAG: hypothetical protein ACRDUT_08605 [Mycobacterium sp.]